MPRTSYENFDVIVTRNNAVAANDIGVFLSTQFYDARVRSDLGGDADITFTLGDAPPPVVSTLARHITIAFAPAPAAPVANTPPLRVADVGRYLFRAIFRDRMRDALRRVQDRLSQRDGFLLRLRFDLTSVPELTGLPWEMLCDDDDYGGYYSLSGQTSIVRYQGGALPADVLGVRDRPLRVLVVISNPNCPPRVPELNVEGEWTKINEALRLLGEQVVILEPLRQATLNALTDRLLDPAKPPVHILHFIGHGDFENGQGQLVFESDGQSANGFELVDGLTLGQRIRANRAAHPSLRLAVLNACEGAMTSRTDAYAGVAQNLLRAGNVPAVIAMRVAISDNVAITYAQTFYEWLLQKNLSLDGALTRARMKMRDVEGWKDNGATPAEWATPILFMRDHSGYLMDDPPPPSPPPPTDPLLSQVAAHSKVVLTALMNGKLTVFLGLDVNLYGRAVNPQWQPGATLPGYSELVNHMVAMSNHPAPFIPSLTDASQYARLSTKEGPFYDTLTEIFTSPAVAPTALHRFWAEAAAKFRPNSGAAAATGTAPASRRFLIVSNTYDNTLEVAFQEKLDVFHVVSYIVDGKDKGTFRHTRFAKTNADDARSAPQSQNIIKTPNKYGDLDDDAPVILKIPGPPEAGGRFAITEDQYLDLLSNRELATIIPAQLLDKLRHSSHLFLGCNVRDWSLRALLYRIWEDDHPAYDSWAVVPKPSAVERTYWKASNVEIIECELKSYLSELAKNL